MRLTEMVRVIWINIIQNKFKVILTSLGIIVGAATIVLVIAIGKGGEAEIIKQFGDLSAATLYINPDYSKSVLFDMDISKLEHLTFEHIGQIKEENPYLENIMLVGTAVGDVTLNGEKSFMSITGVTEEYEQILNFPTAYGENLTNEDVENNALLAVLGYNMAAHHYGIPEYAVGEYIKINERLYKVIGVLARKGDSIGGISADSSVFIPYSTAAVHIFNEYIIPQVVALADDVAHVEAATVWIHSSLNYLLDSGDSYTIEDAGSRMEAATQSAKTMSTILISVAAIVFVVSGIGIMNVLFVSVKERTREIGILKALGCSEHDILLQFLLESVFISLFGSGIGMAASFLILPFMKYTDVPVMASVEGQLAALFFSLLTGTVFGYYPAYRASKQKPVDALNCE